MAIIGWVTDFLFFWKQINLRVDYLSALMKCKICVKWQ